MSQADATEIDLDEAIRLFHKLMPPKEMDALQPPAPMTVHTPWVAAWLMVYQRLRGAASLQDAVVEATRIDPEFPPDNKRIREDSLSPNTGGFARARSRLPVELAEPAADRIAASLIERAAPAWRGRHVFLIDGSTLSLAATESLRRAFPPPSNQHGRSHWPVLRLATAHEISGGTSPRPEIGPMTGSKAIGEVELTTRLIERLPSRSLLVADRNFGIFAFAWMARRTGHDILPRLTAQRFKALARRARVEGPGRWVLTWRPSPSDRRADPSLPDDATLTLRLHEVRVAAHLTLWLVTSLDEPAEVLGSIHHKRQDIETDPRDLKCTLKAEDIRGKTPEMVRKELAAATIAHNLVILIRRLGAARAGVEPRRLSFARVLSVTRGLIMDSRPGATRAERERWLDRAIRMASQCRLPDRPGRSYPREVVGRRTKFPRGRAKTGEAPQSKCHWAGRPRHWAIREVVAWLLRRFPDGTSVAWASRPRIGGTWSGLARGRDAHATGQCGKSLLGPFGAFRMGPQ